MGRGGADELVANTFGLPADAPLNVVGARAIELALIAGNKNMQFVEWVDHGYGIVSLTAERAIFEWWWQDKLTPGSPDGLGYQMVSWAQQDTSALPPRFQDQIDSVVAHGMRSRRICGNPRRGLTVATAESVAAQAALLGDRGA